MDYRGKDNGWITFLEHWGLALTAAISLLTAQLFLYLINLSGVPWIAFFFVSLILLFLGAGLIVLAKLPLYRSGRFLTFGVKTIPDHLKSHYRWGWRVFLFGVVLSLWLLLSSH